MHVSKAVKMPLTLAEISKEKLTNKLHQSCKSINPTESYNSFFTRKLSSYIPTAQIHPIPTSANFSFTVKKQDICNGMTII